MAASTIGVLSLVMNMLFFSFILTQPFTEDTISYFSPAEILGMLNKSCLLAADISLHGQETEIWLQLQAIFSQDPEVALGVTNVRYFAWPNGDHLHLDHSHDSDVDSTDVLFCPHVKADRTCLMKPNIVINPKCEMYSGPLEVEPLVDYINSKCGTFRAYSGQLTSAGMLRKSILSNLFHVDSIANITMHDLHRSRALHNPLKDKNAKQNTFSPGEGAEDTENICNDNDQSSCQSGRRSHNDMPQCKKIDLPLTTRDFYDIYLKQSKPVIIKNAVKSWAAYTKWTHDYFQKTYGKRVVHVKMTPGGDFEGVENADLWEDYDTFSIPDEVKSQLPFPDLVVVRPAGVSMNFSDFLDLIRWAAKQPSRNVSAYLEYSSIPEYMPELECDLEEFSFAKELLTRRHLNIWLSDGNTLGRIHFDPYDNFLCQV